MKNYKQIKKSMDNKLLSIIIYVASIVLMISFIIQMINGYKFDNIFGYTLRIVVSSSMEPEIQINSLNLIEICDVADIEKDDIICFNYNQDIVHRVIDKVTIESGAEVLHTKGDANEFPDSVSITDNELVGKVVRTLNWVAPIITKYSITPGNIDSAALSRNIMLQGLLVGIVLYLIALTIHWVVEFSTSLKKSKKSIKTIDDYIKDIDELILYRELLKDVLDKDVKNNADTRFEFIGNKVSKAFAIQSCNALHTELESFKKDIKRALFLADLFKTFDDNNGEDKRK